MIRKNNKSGENGIHWEERNGARGWIVQWNQNKKQIPKLFSCSKYASDEDALQAAKRFRDEKYAEIGNTNGKRRRINHLTSNPIAFEKASTNALSL